jgi:putative transposase
VSKRQAELAGRLLGVHWTTVYRLRRRYIADPVASSLLRKVSGPFPGRHHVSLVAEAIVQDVLSRWLARHGNLAHPLRDITMEVRARCSRAGVEPLSRSTVARRWAKSREAQALALAEDPAAAIPPGHLTADRALELVQIDHTQADVFIVDDVRREVIGRPWVTLAIDVASRCVLAVYIAMDRPNAATVALLLTRVVLPKAQWLASIGLPSVEWPMNGLPEALHLDNAAEFRSRALRTGCRQYGIDLVYRPVGRPNFGGHIERLNRTLMERLRGLPGASQTIEIRRRKKAPPPEASAKLSLREFERWLVLEIAQRYHHSEHRGLMGSTPDAAWRAMQPKQVRKVPSDPAQQLRFLIQFLPLQHRTIQNDGLSLFYLRYWHPIFAAWRELKRQVTVRYHPEDLSRIFVTADGRTYVEARFAHLARPPISLAEQRMARRALRAAGQPALSEALIFKAIEQQRDLVARATAQTRRVRSLRLIPGTPGKSPWADRPSGNEAAPAPAIDYSKEPEESHVELWPAP